MDLEGIVAKLKHSPYIVKERSRDWVKIKNPEYSQSAGRTNCSNENEKNTLFSIGLYFTFVSGR